MANKTKALHAYLVSQAEAASKDWHSLQDDQPGSDYSPSAPESTQKKITEHATQYIKQIAASLLNDSEETQESLRKWTIFAAADRVESDTSIDEVIKSNKILRRVLWKHVRNFSAQSKETITVEDIFMWEERLNKALDFTLESFTYHFMNMLLDRLASQASLIRELSAPVISITPDIGLLPIIGDIDTERAKGLLESTIEQSVDTGISVLILDLSGVVMVDTMVAHQLFQMIDSLKLIGVKTVLTGIRPEVAQTSIQLGLDFSEVQTESSLKKVFMKILRENQQ
ncbi:MAG: STAS domain-containing protein [Bacillus sp. (in: firmicutes)]